MKAKTKVQDSGTVPVSEEERTMMANEEIMKVCEKYGVTLRIQQSINIVPLKYESEEKK